MAAAKAMLASGSLTAAEVARQLGCAPSTLYRHVPGGRDGDGGFGGADSFRFSAVALVKL